MFRLNAENVSTVFSEVLFQDGELPELPSGTGIEGISAFLQDEGIEFIVGRGIMATVFFHKGRLEGARDRVKDMLRQLPSSFDRKLSGGGSFLNGCMDRDGNQWGEHTHMDFLFSLGMGLGLVTCVFPREVWPALPGGVPYYAIDFDSFDGASVPGND